MKTLSMYAAIALVIVTLGTACAATNPIAVNIIPKPQQLAAKPGGFLIKADTRIVMNAKPSARDTATATLLRRKVWDMTGQLLKIVKSGPKVSTKNVIAIGDPAKNTALASIIASWPDARGKASKSEGYLLGIRDSSIVIRGFDQAGTFYGCQTLIQIMEYYGRKKITGLFCYDYPELKWRGTYLRVRHKFDVPFTKEVISEIVARYKINTLEFDISYGTIWKSHPELYQGDPAGASHMSDVAPLVDVCRQYFIEPIPACESWVHAWEWLTADNLNSELRENPTEGGGPDQGGETLCPRNPAAQKLVHDIWEELISVFHPKYLHTGWDEASHICSDKCPYCKGKDPVASFNEFLWSDYNYLHARGITPLMWGDMLVKSRNGNEWKTYKALSTMPKGTIVQDWDYGSTTDYPEITAFNDLGLTTLGAPYGVYKPGIANIYYWGVNAKKYNMLGLVAFNKWRPGFRRDPTYSELSMWPYYAEWGWSPGGRSYDPAPFDGTTEVKAQLAPDVPTNLTASAATGGARLTWTNPPEAELQGTWICYRTDRYPTDPIDGKFAGDPKGAPKASMSFTHKAAPRGTVYYAAFSHDSIRHFSPVATAKVKTAGPR